MKRLVFIFLLLIFALCAGAYTITPKSYLSIGSFYDREENSEFSIQEEKIIFKSIRFVGDIMLARNVENFMRTYGSDYPFSLLPLHPKESLLVGNFEASIPVTHVPTPSMQFSFSVDTEFVPELQKYGFSHLGLANNHSYDFGGNNFKNSYKTIKDAKMLPFGDAYNQASSTIEIASVGSTTVALIGLYAVHNVPSQTEIVTLINRASLQSDIQIVYIHWGEEYIQTHNKQQENLAHLIIDAGAETIIGHHPHVVQDIELYKNRLIFYSLGNFIFDQYFEQNVQEGLMLEMTPKGNTLHFELLPVTSIGSRSQPRLMSEFEKEVFLTQLAKNSDTELGVMIKAGFIAVPIY